MSDEQIGITGLILCAVWMAASYTRRYFRKPAASTPLQPEVRPESADFAAHADEAIAMCDDSIGALFDELHDMFAPTLAEIRGLPETEASQ